MHCKTIFGVALWAILSLTANAQTNNHNVRALSLKECLDLALAHNLDVQIERYSPEIARYFLKASYGAFDPTLELNVKRTVVDQPQETDFKKYIGSSSRTNNEYELAIDSIGPGLLGRLPTGLSYEVFARSDYRDGKTFDQMSPTVVSRPPVFANEYYTTAGITLRQPLLKDFWIDPFRRSIQLSKNELKMSELAFKGLIMSNVTSVAAAYFDLIFAREQITVEKKALELANQLLLETRKKVEAGTQIALDEKQAESDIETIQTALFAAQQSYAEQENKLKNMLTDNYQSWMDIRIIPSENLAVTELPANRTVSWVNALSRRPDVQQRRLDLERQDIILRFNYNQLFPSLDLVGSYGWQAVQQKFNNSFDDLTDGKHPFYSVGVVFSIPLPNTAARNTYKANQLAKKQALLRFKAFEQGVITEIDTAVKLAETTYKQISSTRKAREYAQAALEAQQTQYLNGTTTSFVVQEFQRNLTRARSAEIRALTDYNIALARLSLSEGTTLERNRIDLKIK